jgi:hypothetical protein
MDLVKFLTWVGVQVVMLIATAFAGAALFLCEVGCTIENISWKIK